LIAALSSTIPKGFAAKGNIFVFIDEAHRTQSGKMHEAMKKLLPGAMFIGFTGTPLLKADKATSIETFGSFVHTYKFDEAVEDGVVLDLRYEARNIDQDLTSPEKVDQWFEAKTKGMTDLSKAELKKRAGAPCRKLSARSRVHARSSTTSCSIWTPSHAVLTLDTYADLFPDDLEMVSAALDHARSVALKSAADQLRTETEKDPELDNQSGPLTCIDTSRGGGIRTHDLFVPNEARYQAAPHPA
jgi:superfamily II DNA or RNA helicase